VCVCVC